MKITNIKVTHVNVPFDAPFWWTGSIRALRNPSSR